VGGESAAKGGNGPKSPSKRSSGKKEAESFHFGKKAGESIWSKASCPAQCERNVLALSSRKTPRRDGIGRRKPGSRPWHLSTSGEIVMAKGEGGSVPEGDPTRRGGKTPLSRRPLRKGKITGPFARPEWRIQSPRKDESGKDRDVSSKSGTRRGRSSSGLEAGHEVRSPEATDTTPTGGRGRRRAPTNCPREKPSPSGRGAPSPRHAVNPRTVGKKKNGEKPGRKRAPHHHLTIATHPLAREPPLTADKTYPKKPTRKSAAEQNNCREITLVTEGSLSATSKEKERPRKERGRIGPAGWVVK